MGYSQTSEPIRFERDCAAVMVPQGETVTLPAGQVGYVTQALGGSFTVYVDGNLFRIRGADADALGKEPPPALELPEGAGDEDVEKLVWQQLRTCFDPEIPINIVELGLVYSCVVERLDDGTRKVNVEMTLTAPACPVAGSIVAEVESRVENIPEVPGATVELVWDPPWTKEKMSEAALLELGLL